MKELFVEHLKIHSLQKINENVEKKTMESKKNTFYISERDKKYYRTVNQFYGGTKL